VEGNETGKLQILSTKQIPNKSKIPNSNVQNPLRMNILSICVCLGFRISYGAGDGTRTRDFQLGKLTLYQLSYARNKEFYKSVDDKVKKGQGLPL
jgi:hypothetical protein